MVAVMFDCRRQLKFATVSKSATTYQKNLLNSAGYKEIQTTCHFTTVFFTDSYKITYSRVFGYGTRAVRY